MAETIIDQFVVLFGLDSKGFAKGQRDIEDSSKKLKDTTKKTFDGIEQAGKGAASSVKGVATEVIGLGLAFFGMKSIVGFATDMLTGSAAADRMGQTLGMATGKVIAWRQAMGTVGGQEGEADAGLKAVEKAMQDYHHFGSTGNDPLWMSMGVNKKDLMGTDPGEVLQKLAAQRGNFSGPDFANRLQMLGLPEGMVNFLMQGGGAVKGTLDKYGTPEMLKQYQAQAKAAENLQQAMNDLKVSIVHDLIPPVTDIAHGLVKLLNLKPTLPRGAPGDRVVAGNPDAHWWSPLTTVYAGKGKPGAGGLNLVQRLEAQNYLMSKGVPSDKLAGIMAGMGAEGGGLGMATNGAFGIGQWRGSRQRALFAKYGGHPSLTQQLDFMLWELHGGDHGGKAVMDAQGTEATLLAYIHKFMRPDLPGSHAGSAGDIGRAHAILAHAARPQNLAKLAGKTLEGRKVILLTQNVTVNTQAKDPHAVARAVHHHLKQRVMVAQADTGVRP